LTTKLPFHILAKPIGPICNLDCHYCFYLDRESLFPQNRKASDFRMNEETLEKFIQQYIHSQPGREVQFGWQGGEPTLLGLDYFRLIVELQKRHAVPGKRISNMVQTNGTLLDEPWCEFLAKEKFLVGLSIDGPRELHDRYRLSRDGKPTFDEVWRGMNLLKQHGVEFATLTVVHRELAHHALEVYEFLREHGSRLIQFIPLVERDAAAKLRPQSSGGRLTILQPEPTVEPWTVEAVQFGRFLCEIFDRWVRRDVGRTVVQTFDVQLGIWAGQGSSLCVFGDTCGRALAIEHSGDLYSCDHFVSPEYHLGNIHSTPLTDMIESPKQRKFGLDKRSTLPKYCQQCEVRFACNGECPKNRFILTPDGEPGLNYLCAGYKLFLNHIRPYMQTMTVLLRQSRRPSDIMQILAAQEGREVESGGPRYS
jgi:uncharacterized protein